jgi:hypothetical protein
LFRLQRKIGLIPENRVWALVGGQYSGRFWRGCRSLSGLGKKNICCRSMVANHCLPTSESMPDLLLCVSALFIVAEGMMHSTLTDFAATPRQFRRRATWAT